MGLRLNVRPSEADSSVINLQAGARVYHPPTCKFIKLESFLILHNPVYKKTGGSFLVTALFGQKWDIVSTKRAQLGLKPRKTDEIKTGGIEKPLVETFSLTSTAPIAPTKALGGSG